ncbi:MAG: DUF3881 family protein [Lachnospiraceae bacterium]|nr:DUF3881 family protein [Lachnospiraceae bacterium]
MHSYLTSVGFHDINKKQMEYFLRQIQENPDFIEHALDTEGNEFAELRRELAPGIGIALRGTYDEADVFHREYYFPYCYGSRISTSAKVELVRASDKESLMGICDEMKLGVDLIFFVQDMFQVLISEQRNQRIVNFGGVKLSGLALDGSVVLPVKTPEVQAQRTKRNVTKRKELIQAAREGDQKAIERLTLIDMDLYSHITNRVEKEDILTIVNSYFMPSGIECDKYSIMGEIQGVARVENEWTKEILYVLNVVSNEVECDVCISAKDLLGEPEVGRRFKGRIWLQGNVTGYR